MSKEAWFRDYERGIRTDRDTFGGRQFPMEPDAPDRCPDPDCAGVLHDVWITGHSAPTGRVQCSDCDHEEAAKP